VFNEVPHHEDMSA